MADVPDRFFEDAGYLRMAAAIVSAYIGNNLIHATELPDLIASVHDALLGVASPPDIKMAEAPKPAVPIKKSVAPDRIICLEDGKAFKSLKRHLRARYGMTPDEYRAKWGLAPDYPMVAPAYAKERSALAKQMGLGQQRRRTSL